MNWKSAWNLIVATWNPVVWELLESALYLGFNIVLIQGIYKTSREHWSHTEDLSSEV